MDFRVNFAFETKTAPPFKTKRAKSAEKTHCQASALLLTDTKYNLYSNTKYRKRKSFFALNADKRQIASADHKIDREDIAMAIIGIIAEYNPFHTGHEYHIARSRELLGADSTVICVMSGDFVRRGEAALYSKFAEPKPHASCRADLAIEPPAAVGAVVGGGLRARCGGTAPGRWALRISASAASAAMCGGLKRIAENLIDPAVNAEISRELNENANNSYASARQTVLARRLGTRRSSSSDRTTSSPSSTSRRYTSSWT